MSSSVLLMSMSVDGYIAGPNDAPGNPGGDGFMRLHEWYKTADGDFGRPEGPAADIWDELNATGAVLVGRRTAEQVDLLRRRPPRCADLRAEPPAGAARGAEVRR